MIRIKIKYLFWPLGAILKANWEIEYTKPSPNWPDSGVVEFQDYSTRYREGLDLVLKNVNVKVQSMEKVGICGRTG